MTDDPNSIPDSSMRKMATRRNAVIFAGAGIATVVLGQSVAGKDHDKDEHDDHSDHNDGEDVQPKGTVPADSAEVRIDDDDTDGFEPGTITIDLGKSVTWVNVDDDPHTATGADFDTGTIEPGEQATITFEEPGRYPYTCNFHPIMAGVVEVRDENGQVPAQTTASPGASPMASPTASQQVSVSLKDFKFDPSELHVVVGTMVIWTNNESFAHTVTATDKSFSSETLQLGDTFTYTFDEAGTFEYFCAIHALMDATVIVTE